MIVNQVMNHLKVLTVKNPFAFLILAGVKKYEIRSWNTKYRGQLYIHSAKQPSKENSILLAVTNQIFPLVSFTLY